MQRITKLKPPIFIHQVFHICNDGRKISFLCPNGTIFQQSDLICEWWFKVNCTNSPNLYEESAEHLREDILRRKANRRVVDNKNNHGAVMRTEEQHSVSASTQGSRNHEVRGSNNNQFGNSGRNNGERNRENGNNRGNHQQQQKQSSVYRGKPQKHNNFDLRSDEDQNSYEQQQKLSENQYQHNQEQSKLQYQKNSDQFYSATTQKPKTNEKSYTNKPKSSSGGTLSRNDLLNRKLAPNESEETQITQETASFYKNNNANNNLQQTNQYNNHRETYSDLKNPTYYSKPPFTTTTNVYTTQRINNGQPFVSKTFGAKVQSNSYNSASTTPLYEAQSTVQTPVTVSPERKALSQKYDAKLTPPIKSLLKTDLKPSVPTEGKYTFHFTTTQSPNEEIFNVAGSTQNYATSTQGTTNTEPQSTTSRGFYQGNTGAGSGSYGQKLNLRNSYYTSTPPASYYSTGTPVDTTTQNQFSTGYSYNSIAPNSYQTTTQVPYYYSTPSTQYTRNQDYGVTSTLKPYTGETESPNRQGYTYQSTTNGAYSGSTTLAPTEYSTNQYISTSTPASTYGSTSFTSNTQSPVVKFNLALSGYQNNNVQSNKRSKQPARNSAYTTEAPSTTTIGNRFNEASTTSAPGSTINNYFGNQNRNNYFSPTVLPQDASTLTPTTTSKPESYRSTTTEGVTELFNTGKEYGSTADIQVPSTLSPELVIVKNSNRSIPSYANTKEETLLTSSSARPSQRANANGNAVPSSKKLSSSTYSVNKLNFLANGSPSVSTPKIILGIIRNDNSKKSRPNKNNNNKLSNGFYVTKSQSTATPSYGQKIGAPKGTIEPPHFHSNHEVARPKPFSRSSTGNSLETNVVSSTLPPFEQTTTQQFSETPETASYDISSASPFRPATTTAASQTVASTLPTTLATAKPLSTYENVDNMINALMEIANLNSAENYEGETPRPGLTIPPSVGPQTLHSLAVYFANALDNIAAGKAQNETNTEAPVTEVGKVEEEKALDALLTHSTADKYKELFKEKDEQVTSSTTDADNDLETQNSGNAVQTTPRIRHLAQVFTQALSAYLDDPVTFRKVLEQVRPTEPPTTDSFTGMEEDEVLNFSDADINNRKRLSFPTAPSLLDPSPTWGFLIKFNDNNNTPDISANSLSNETVENLHSADSQSFVSQFNNLPNDKKTSFAPTTLLPPVVEDLKKFNEQLQPATPTPAKTDEESNKTLPTNHWTKSPDATKLWQNTLSINPSLVNANLDSGLGSATASSLESTEIDVPQPTAEISYELKSLPKIELNATQVHGILIDFMNKTEESDKLQRILKKLNTTEDEFLTKMKEIEANPLTRRLILLLISECGANASKELEAATASSTTAAPSLKLSNSKKPQEETLISSSSSAAVLSRREAQPSAAKNSHFKQIIHPSLEDEDQDTRALHLLNSLYTIASQFGK